MISIVPTGVVMVTIITGWLAASISTVIWSLLHIYAIRVLITRPSALCFPKFVPDGAALYHEFRKAGTSA